MNTNATNSTTNYGLPKFIANDKPAWLIDWNNTMDELDSIISSLANLISNISDNADDMEEDISNLQEVVGNMDSGLVKDVSTLKSEVEDTDGLIDQMTSVKSDLLSQNGLITSLDQRVTALENA